MSKVILSISLTMHRLLLRNLIIKDFNTRKDFYEFCQCKIDLWKENYNILDPKVGDLIENSFV